MKIKGALKELQDQLDINDQKIPSLESNVKKINSTPSVDMLVLKNK